MHPHEYGLTQALYGVDDTCEKLGIGRNSLYALIHSGELVPIKFGRKTLIAAPDIVPVILARRGASLPMVYKTPDTNPKPLAKRGRPAKVARSELEAM